MTQNNQNRSFLSAFWARLKRSLEPETADLKRARQVRFLERCLRKDCLTEKVRKRLERQWSEIST
ncbi:MAG: hypothetical protein AAGN15_08885 [Cyanobacteria bacterium J06581_3]